MTKPLYKKNIFWIILFIFLMALCGGSYLLLAAGNITGDENTVLILQDNELVRTINMRDADRPSSFTLERNGKKNTVEIDENGIRVASADCPDQICVNQGYLNSYGTPIVCLPNRLVIRWDNPSNEDDIDAATGH